MTTREADVTHLTTEQIEAGMDDVLAAPRDRGRLEMIVVRPNEDQRATPTRARCTIAGGVEGDNWVARGSRHTADGSANPDQQITMMNARYLDLVAGSRERWPLAGDQLIVDLSLSEDALVAGDRLRIGEVVVEVTAHPHTGCDKFRDRFGVDAVRYANSPLGRRHHLRGIHVRVVAEGEISVGDAIERALD
jgi:MOSC domain-containing protein YiiM